MVQSKTTSVTSAGLRWMATVLRTSSATIALPSLHLALRRSLTVHCLRSELSTGIDSARSGETLRSGLAWYRLGKRGAEARREAESAARNRFSVVGAAPMAKLRVPPLRGDLGP